MYEKMYCPLNGCGCPYFLKSGECTCPKPEESCDDYIAFWKSFDYDEYTLLEGRSE